MPLQDFAILDYRVNMRLDNLPVAEMNVFAWEGKPQETIEVYNLGYPLGRKYEVPNFLLACNYKFVAGICCLLRGLKIK